MSFPTPEETGFPINGTLEEKDAHHKKYGRTPLHPKIVKEMLDRQSLILGYVSAILVVTNETQPNAEVFCQSIDEMLAWIPKPENGPDYGINFAAKARKHLALVKERLPRAIEQLTQLSAALESR